jgi:broad-specificity NMP kinase
MVGKLAKARLKKRMKKRGYKPFKYHSLKAHGTGDFNGDILEATGHRDPKMRKVYKRKLEVEATR